jgi:hypothetical protein
MKVLVDTSAWSLALRKRNKDFGHYSKILDINLHKSRKFNHLSLFISSFVKKCSRRKQHLVAEVAG